MEKDNEVSFKNGGASFSGVLGGAAFAIGVPMVILSNPSVLSQSVNTALVIGAIIGGGFIIFVSAFFGLVMPSRVQGYGDEQNRDSSKK